MKAGRQVWVRPCSLVWVSECDAKCAACMQAVGQPVTKTKIADATRASTLSSPLKEGVRDLTIGRPVWPYPRWGEQRC